MYHSKNLGPLHAWNARSNFSTQMKSFAVNLQHFHTEFKMELPNILKLYINDADDDESEDDEMFMNFVTSPGIFDVIVGRKHGWVQQHLKWVDHVAKH